MGREHRTKHNPPGDRLIASAPAARTLAAGPEWGISEYVCTAGPADRPFEERHELVTMAAVATGTFTYRSNAGREVLYPGAILLGNARTWYECGHDHSHGDRCVALQVTPEYFSEVAASAAGSSTFTFSSALLPAGSGTLPVLTRLETQAGFAEQIAIEEAVSGLVETFIVAAAASKPAAMRPSAADERRISNAVHYIETHACHPLDLNALASIAAMSKYHFLRTFRCVAGVTPHQFILSIRMRRAALRLSTSNDAVAVIAFESGFGDLSTFNRRFRDVYGVSPMVYRSRGCTP